MNEFIKSFKYAIEGIIVAIKEERNLKIHICIMILVIICGFIFKISTMEWIICIILFGLVISLELVNTAIENAVDLVTLEKNPKAKIAKDVAAGAVLISAIVSAIIGFMIFIPKLN
ncbi:MAG: diacylglycerol kinase family protein [Clostridia bacterium]|nr:diacylglycerol kinase family protein [Clostridia bacterium]